ncbi:hypothetical protein CHUAL_012645 [Chamberlinius hualienensis]
MASLNSATETRVIAVAKRRKNSAPKKVSMVSTEKSDNKLVYVSSEEKDSSNEIPEQTDLPNLVRRLAIRNNTRSEEIPIPIYSSGEESDSPNAILEENKRRNVARKPEKMNNTMSGVTHNLNNTMSEETHNPINGNGQNMYALPNYIRTLPPHMYVPQFNSNGIPIIDTKLRTDIYNGLSPASSNNSGSLLSVVLPPNLDSSIVVDQRPPRKPRGVKRPIPDSEKSPHYYEKREKNNNSAKKSRDNRKEREAHIVFELRRLTEVNIGLQAKIMMLIEDIRKCERLLLTLPEYQSH